MTVHVAGVWELGWNTPIKEADLWEHPLRDFEVDRWWMTPVSGIGNRRVAERATLPEILDQARNDGLTVVFVDERGETPLTDFVHPEHALYVFGKASFSPLSLRKEGEGSIVIDTPANLGGLWPHQAASIVLYDRLLKGDAA